MRLLHLDPAQRNALLRDVLASTAAVRITLTGPSMAPTIDSGDLVELRRFDGKLVIGEIALFESQGGRLFAHRLLGVEQIHGKRQYIFKGDGLTLADQAVDEAQILALVTAVWHRRSEYPVRLPLAWSGIFRPWLSGMLAAFHRLRPWAGVVWRKSRARYIA